MNRRRMVVAGLFAMLVSSQIAWAGEFNEHDGIAIRGYDPVSYFVNSQPVKGVADHKFEYKGSTFVFASKENRDNFAATPEKYAPQYAGYCAFGVAAGGVKVDIDPNAYAVVDGKLYLNVNPAVQKKWAADIPSFIKTGDEKWPEVSKQTTVKR